MKAYDTAKAIEYIYLQNDNKEKQEAVFVLGFDSGTSGRAMQEYWAFDLQPLFKMKGSQISGKKNTPNIIGGNLRKLTWAMTGKPERTRTARAEPKKRAR